MSESFQPVPTVSLKEILDRLQAAEEALKAAIDALTTAMSNS